MFNRLRLSTKIVSGFIVVLLLLVVVALLGYRGVCGDLDDLLAYRQLARADIAVARINEQFLLCRLDAKEYFRSKDEKTSRSYETNAAALLRAIDAGKTNFAGERVLKSVDSLQNKFSAYDKKTRELITVSREGNTLREQQLESELVGAGTEITTALEDMSQIVVADQVALGEKFQARVTVYKVWIITASCLAVLLGLTAALWLTAHITRPVNDLTFELERGAEQTRSSAQQVASASEQLAQGASEQAASLQESSASLEEIASMIQRNSANALKANGFAKGTRLAASNGVDDMKSMSQAMLEIKNSSDDVAQIIKTIDEIAFQTNILALNAAVEAARAGESGMGFAVVASEVRNLAQRSAQAAKETAVRIENAISRTAQGVAINAKVAKSLQEIEEQSRALAGVVEEIAAASNEQSQGIEQINQAVGQMDQVTQSNASSAEESANASEELSAQAEALSEAVNRLAGLVEGSGLKRRAQSSPSDITSDIPSSGYAKVPPRNRPSAPKPNSHILELSE